ncbi:uncharacterized protein [Mytilus edulis]|uniref:uncharacterized protein n=1 Tax=Mytilus edulis TaxID=6550 RepID=UPI0039EEEFD0
MGIPVEDEKISILLYADDIALVTENERGMHAVLDVLNKWCEKWRLNVNSAKSSVMHFRKGRIPRTSLTFKIGNEQLQIVEQYKYLGVNLSEKLKYTAAADAFAKAGGRALGAAISKVHSYK